MDETLKALLMTAAGGLGFLGGLLTFLNGRLKDAESPDARAKVWERTLDITVLAVNVVGATLIAIGWGRWGLAIFSVAYAVEFFRFIRRDGPITRGEIAVWILLTCMFTAIVVLVFVAGYFDRVLAIIERLTAIVDRTSPPKKIP